MKGRLTDDDWKGYTSTRTAKAPTVDHIYTSTSIHTDLNPANIKLREARDCDTMPESTAIIVALDVTGSMSNVLDAMAREGLKVLAAEIYDRKPVTDPHIMYMGVGDVDAGDRAPLQVTQFETDIKIAEQLTQIWLERRGGGNDYEGYNLPWYFAGMKTSIDCFEKRGKKGYLFTVGDEQTPRGLSKEAIKKVFGDDIQENMTNEQLLAMVSRSYNVYHIIVNEGNHYQRYPDKVDRAWRNLIGQNAVNLTDHKKLSEVIVSIIQLNEGFVKDEIIKSWDDKTSDVVSVALASAEGALAKPAGSGVVNFE